MQLFWEKVKGGCTTLQEGTNNSQAEDLPLTQTQTCHPPNAKLLFIKGKRGNCGQQKGIPEAK